MFFKTRLYFTGTITIFIWLLLTWNYFHGGVPSHHILKRKDFPEIANWWGGLLLPLLTWFLLYRIQKRISSANDGKLAIHTSGACSPKLLIFFGLKRQNFEKKCIFNLPLLPTNCQSICQPD
jgi:hypothetical protein